MSKPARIIREQVSKLIVAGAKPREAYAKAYELEKDYRKSGDSQRKKDRRLKQLQQKEGLDVSKTDS